MNQSDKNRQEFINDELRKFLIHEEIERAPVDFTGKLMELIKKEPMPVVAQNKKFRFATVPVIYCAVLTALAIITLFVPNVENDATDNSWFQTLYNLLPEMPIIELNIPLTFTIPETLKYIIIGCFGLFIFDLFLNRYFQLGSRQGNE